MQLLDGVPIDGRVRLLPRTWLRPKPEVPRADHPHNSRAGGVPVNVHWGHPSGPVVLKLDARSPHGPSSAEGFITEHRIVEFDIPAGEKWHHYTCDTHMVFGEKVALTQRLGDQVAVDGIGFEVIESIEGPF